MRRSLIAGLRSWRRSARASSGCRRRRRCAARRTRSGGAPPSWRGRRGWGSTTARSGRPASASSGRISLRASRFGSGRSRSVEARVLLRVHDRLGDGSTPRPRLPDSPGSARGCRSRSRGRRRARIQSARPSLRRSGRGGPPSVLVWKKARWEIRKRRPLASSRCSAPSAPVGRSVPPPGPRRSMWRSTGGRGISAGRDEPGSAAVPCRRPPGSPGCEARLATALVVGRQLGRPGPVTELVAAGVVALRGELAVLASTIRSQRRGRESRGRARRRAPPKEYSTCRGSASDRRRLDRLQLEALQPPRRTSESSTWDCFWRSCSS